MPWLAATALEQADHHIETIARYSSQKPPQPRPEPWDSTMASTAADRYRHVEGIATRLEYGDAHRRGLGMGTDHRLSWRQ